MVKYVLTTFHTHDEEIETVHLPVVFTAILGLLTVSVNQLSYTISELITIFSHSLRTTEQNHQSSWMLWP